MKVKFNFSQVVFLSVDREPLPDDEFKKKYGGAKNVVIANAIFERCPSGRADLAALCFDIVKGNISDVEKETLSDFEKISESLPFPISEPIKRYIKTLI